MDEYGAMLLDCPIDMRDIGSGCIDIRDIVMEPGDIIIVL